MHILKSICVCVNSKILRETVTENQVAGVLDHRPGVPSHNWMRPINILKIDSKNPSHLPNL